jgi:hypothetical protein
MNRAPFHQIMVRRDLDVQHAQTDVLQRLSLVHQSMHGAKLELPDAESTHWQLRQGVQKAGVKSDDGGFMSCHLSQRTAGQRVHNECGRKEQTDPHTANLQSYSALSFDAPPAALFAAATAASGGGARGGGFLNLAAAGLHA